MLKKLTYKSTLFSCFSGYVTQSIAVNFLPLLFVTFCTGYGISLEKVTLLVTVNFLLQLLTDLASAKLIDKIGYRAGIVGANVLAAFGLFAIAFLPEVVDPFAALVFGVVLCAIGSGLEEVLISPIVEACPTKRKSAAMSLAHSFYCWGTVAVIALSTVFFAAFGVQNWKWLACAWAVVPVFNASCFLAVPIYNLKERNEARLKIGDLLKNKTFWLLAVLMTCAGASEQAMGQWASAFAESALGVDKTVGDLAGPCFFAVMMGISRTLYATLSEKINLRTFTIICSGLCIASYIIAVFAPLPWMGLVACGLCGFSVGVMWPGTISVASVKIVGGTGMFALLALFGDVGCSLGPTVVGFVSGAFGDDLKKGLICVVIFPVLMISGALALGKKKKGFSTLDGEKTKEEK